MIKIIKFNQSLISLVRFENELLTQFQFLHYLTSLIILNRTLLYIKIKLKK